MSFLTTLRQKIEFRLYTLGFSSDIVRHLLCTQILLCVVPLIAGILLCPITLWPLSFTAGALIATYSIWNIARFAEAHVNLEFTTTLGLKLFFSFSGRFLLIGVALFALIVWFKLPIIPLVIGLSSTVAGIVTWGVARLSRKTAKEA
ncbi:MAG: ATP synthase subunit I [Desulfovibrio sp.]|jgi:hypothetical protein|nr:ATP synthase subunit I [Desulfovibrio sp.]